MSSGALVQLVSQGVQSAFTTVGELSKSLYRQRYSRSTNFSQSPQELDVVGQVAAGSRSTVKIQKFGDIVNYMWIQVPDAVNILKGTEFELYIGSQLIDTQTFDYMSDIWQVYLAETKSKASGLNTMVSTSDSSFVPFHFFFCDNNQFLPLISLPYVDVQIRIKWGPSIDASNLRVFANFVYLDTPEREYWASGDTRDIMITQVQKLDFNATDGNETFDLSPLRHPVKALFWGHETQSDELDDDYYTFDSARLMINGKELIGFMKPSYYHTVQAYYHTQNAVVNFINAVGCPFYTRYYMYSFSKDCSSYNSTGSCNFSRIDTSNLELNLLSRASQRQNDNSYVYALSINVLRFKSGLAGILFSN